MSTTNATKLPLPLNSIRVFVEAARCLSFSQAARTLGMTQSGVSHHVATLERHLGHRLFQRRGGPLALTDAGHLYFDTVREAIATVELATQQFAPPPADGSRLVVRTSLPSFAQTVLIPVLPRFFGGHAVAVDIVTSLSPPESGDVYDVLISRDLAIGDDDAHWELASEELICVASPQLMREHMGRPIAEWPFIATRSRPDTLASWANRQALDTGSIRLAAAFEHYFLAIPAAIAGIGFLVVPRLLAAGALDNTRLREADLPALRGNGSYRAFINPKSPAQESATAFCRWLKGELSPRTLAPKMPPTIGKR